MSDSLAFAGLCGYMVGTLPDYGLWVVFKAVWLLLTVVVLALDWLWTRKAKR